MLNVSNFSHQHKFWFYVRKAIFQGFLPLILGIITFYGLQQSHSSLYGFSITILFIYANTKIILDFIFSLCSDDILFSKNIDIDSSDNSILELNLDTNKLQNGSSIIVIKKIYKLRYSKYVAFKLIDNLCWFMGIDSPLLIPYEVVSKLNNYQTITDANENQLLHQTLKNLYVYHPTSSFNQNLESDAKLTSSLLNKRSIDTDLQIRVVQQELFGIDNNIDV